MKAKIFTVLGFLYVIFAFTTAYTALAPIETPTQSSTSARVEVDRLERTIFNSKPMDFVDETDTVNVSKEFFIEVWVSNNCKYCEQFKKRELPKLKKAGARYKILNTTIFPPPKDVKYTPTIKIFRRDKLVKKFTGYVKAEKIIKIIDVSVPLLK